MYATSRFISSSPQLWAPETSLTRASCVMLMPAAEPAPLLSLSPSLSRRPFGRVGLASDGTASRRKILRRLHVIFIDFH